MRYREVPRENQVALRRSLRRLSPWRLALIVALILVAGGGLGELQSRTSSVECHRNPDGSGACLLRRSSMFWRKAEWLVLPSIRGMSSLRHTGKGGGYNLFLDADGRHFEMARQRKGSLVEVDASAFNTWLRDDSPTRYNAQFGLLWPGVLLGAVAAILAAVVGYFGARRTVFELERRGQRVLVRVGAPGRMRQLLDEEREQIVSVTVEGTPKRGYELVLRTRLGERVSLERGAGADLARRERLVAEIESFLGQE